MAARRLRELGFDGVIDLYGDEGAVPYERPELSKGYVTGRLPFEKLVCLSEAEAKSLNIEFRLGCPVQHIDAQKRSVASDLGVAEYGAIVLATGGRARSLPGITAPDADILTIRSIADADRLAGALGRRGRVAVIGGGWLGLELAATCRAAGAEVHVYEAADRLCARVAPPWLSGRLAAIHQSHGVVLHLGGAPQIDSTGAFVFDGALFRPDLILVAIGMQANDRLAADVGIACEDGILVDGAGRTSASGIYAIGDCARYRHRGNQRRESWQNANASAENVARAVLDLEPLSEEIDWFWSDQFDVNIQMLGNCAERSDTVLRSYENGAHEALFFMDGASFGGCISVDSPADIAFAKRVMSRGLVVDRDLIADPSAKHKDCIKG